MVHPGETASEIIQIGKTALLSDFSDMGIWIQQQAARQVHADIDKILPGRHSEMNAKQQVQMALAHGCFFRDVRNLNRVAEIAGHVITGLLNWYRHIHFLLRF